jgi:hypothetical protein
VKRGMVMANFKTVIRYSPVLLPIHNATRLYVYEQDLIVKAKSKKL